MTQGLPLESVARSRLRALRKAQDLSLEELAARSNIGASTLSRLETGHRRIAIDHLVVLARALGTTVDDLLKEPQTNAQDVVIHPRRDRAGGSTFWLLTAPEDASGPVVAKMRLPARKRLPEPRVHPGRDWFYVLDGTVRLRLGERELLVRCGQAASFDTTTPHTMAGHGGPAEILSILTRDGERAHLRS